MALIYYCIDIESNGLSVNYHEVSQISIIRCSDRHQLSRYIKIQFPERSSGESLIKTGRTYADLYKGITKEQAIQDIEKFLQEDEKTEEHRCFIGHNVNFDQRFCHALWDSVGKKFPGNCWLCTRALTRAWTKKVGIAKPKLSLGASLELTGIEPTAGAAHNAIKDARDAFLLWKKLTEEEGVDYLQHIKRIPHI